MAYFKLYFSEVVTLVKLLFGLVQLFGRFNVFLYALMLWLLNIQHISNYIIEECRNMQFLVK